jgi:hypothetical protein
MNSRNCNDLVGRLRQWTKQSFQRSIVQCNLYIANFREFGEAMSFSFGFFSEGEDNNNLKCLNNGHESSVACEDSTSVPVQAMHVAEEHLLSNFLTSNADIPFVPYSIGPYQYNKVLIEDQISSIDAESDLIPGVYEGGNKVWECSVDLVVHMHKHLSDLPERSTGRVIELGCGHGFPGVAALKLGYTQVVFSDYNAEVINSVTWPNVVLNCQDISLTDVRCFSGDWDSLPEKIIDR